MDGNDSKDKDKEAHPPIIRKIKKHGHGHHGGSWKIAYADFVTAMMAFFLLMWLLASLNKAQKEGLSEYFKQPLKIALLGGDSMGSRDISVQGGGQNIEKKMARFQPVISPLMKKRKRLKSRIRVVRPMK